MKLSELQKLSEQMDIELGPIHVGWAAEAVTMRLTLECALRLASLDEQGIGISGFQMRGDALCVSIEHNII